MLINIRMRLPGWATRSDAKAGAGPQALAECPTGRVWLSVHELSLIAELAAHVSCAAVRKCSCSFQAGVHSQVGCRCAAGAEIEQVPQAC